MTGLIFSLVFLSLGVIFLVIGVVATQRSKTALTWPVIPGAVLRTDVVRHEDTDSDGIASVSFEPLVEYQYSLMGQAYTGKRIAFGANRYNYKKALEIVSRYPVGEQVNVHYNPEKPREAVLETTAAGGKLFTILGICLLAAGVVVLIISLIL
jgi:hypothetical protein